MADVKSGDTVVPGDSLCVIEEMTPGYGTYENEGVVYASTAGTVSMDIKERTVSVLDQQGRKKIALPEEGDSLVGEVTLVYDQRAEVELVKRNDKDMLPGMVGEIHISNVTRRYLKSMHNALEQGDIIRGKALSNHEIPVELTLVGNEFGVILGKCVKCGNALALTTHNNMICLRCENRETREVADDYGENFGLETRPDLAPRRKSSSRRDDRRGSRRSRR
ncbi:hypothetical protein EU537_01025 [Candidatus Thorarchaeota archaeon]|nr:MAG: hypothetical protein EU537_01025 [Candidatus Thorarchaeota archaeon]